jgi:hypothetical protein
MWEPHPHELPKAPPPNTMTLEIKFPKHDLTVDTSNHSKWFAMSCLLHYLRSLSWTFQALSALAVDYGCIRLVVFPDGSGHWACWSLFRFPALELQICPVKRILYDMGHQYIKQKLFGQTFSTASMRRNVCISETFVLFGQGAFRIPFLLLRLAGYYHSQYNKDSQSVDLV